jgi:hypothetical protein
VSTLVKKDWKDWPDTSTPLTAAAMEELENRVDTAIDGAVSGINRDGIYITAPSWAAARAFRNTNKDGIFYIENFQDASGVASPLTYTKGYGQWGSKTSSRSISSLVLVCTHQNPPVYGLVSPGANL